MSPRSNRSSFATGCSPARYRQVRIGFVILIAASVGTHRLAGQADGVAAQTRTAGILHKYVSTEDRPGKLICPGSFPTDLTLSNCEYTGRQRLQQWVTTSFTDQAMLGAIVFGTGAEIIRSPSEWPRTWEGLGNRIGVRYTQAAARGSAEFIVGSMLRDDPRHLSYKNDPHTHYGTKIKSCSSAEIETISYPEPAHIGLNRVGHALLDSVTVLKSEPCGNGRRLPALDRLVGVWAGAYGGYPWYPRTENTFANVSQRAGTAYGSTLMGSFYTEFSPELFSALSKLFASRKKSQ